MEQDILRQDLLEPGSELSASCCKMRSRNLQSDWSSGYTAVPGIKDTQWHLPLLAQVICVWNNTASLCIWAQPASGPCRCINTVSKAIHAIWRWLTVSSLGFQRLTSVRFGDWSLAHHPQNNPHSKHMKKVTQRTNKYYVVIADNCRQPEQEDV